MIVIVLFDVIDWVVAAVALAETCADVFSVVEIVFVVVIEFVVVLSDLVVLVLDFVVIVLVAVAAVVCVSAVDVSIDIVVVTTVFGDFLPCSHFSVHCCVPYLGLN